MYLNENKKTNYKLKRIIKFNKIFIKKFGKINILIILINEICKYIFNYNYKSTFKEENFPHINSFYKKKNLLLKKRIKTLKMNNLKKIFLSINSVNSIDITRFNISKELILSSINIKKSKKIKQVDFQKLYLKDLKKQIIFLSDFLKQIKKIDNISNKYFEQNFIYYYSNLFTDQKEYKKTKGKILYLGSNQIIHNRVMSARYLLDNKIVNSINHTNFTFKIYDPNISLDSEFSLSSNYFDYFNNNYKNYLIFNSQKSNIIQLKKRKFKKEKLYYNSNNKILYIPKKFLGHKRYFGGIYNQISDDKYKEIQEKILSYNDNIYIKIHPKNLIKKNIKIENKKIITKNFSDVNFSEFKLFVIDTVTQPFFDLAIGDHKILFFNYFDQNFSKKFYKLLRERVLIIDKNPLVISKKQFEIYVNQAINYKIKNNEISKFSKYF